MEKKPDRSNMFRLCRKKDDPTDQIMVFFPQTPTDGKNLVSVQTIQDFYSNMKAEGVRRAIIVTKNGITPFAKTCISKLDGVIMEEFTDSELMVNITKHSLVPPHILITEDEKQALLEKYKIEPSQLPRIQLQDPISRYYGLQKGDIVKIIRPSETAGRYVTYRYVV